MNPYNLYLSYGCFNADKPAPEAPLSADATEAALHNLRTQLFNASEDEDQSPETRARAILAHVLLDMIHIWLGRDLAEVGNALDTADLYTEDELTDEIRVTQTMLMMTVRMFESVGANHMKLLLGDSLFGAGVFIQEDDKLTSLASDEFRKVWWASQFEALTRMYETPEDSDG